MTIDEVFAELEEHGSADVRKRNAKRGVGDKQHGVLRGKLRTIAKRLGRDVDLALDLWATEDFDAQLLAALMILPSKVTGAQLDAMVRTASHVEVADYLSMYVTKKHKERESLRTAWLADDHPMVLRQGWWLTAELFEKGNADGLDADELLARIEADLGAVPDEIAWTMNTCLVRIGIADATERPRALAIGETLGLYRDWPEVPGCTSPYAPIWINEMVGRQSA